MSVSVITPTVNGRESLLDEAAASVAAQTVQVQHHILRDENRDGPGVIRNRLARQADTEWVLPLDDDDVLYPHAIETLLERAGDADIVYPWCHIDTGITALVNKLWDRLGLHRMNYIPVTALIRRDTFEMLGGYRRVPLEDWDLWRRAELHGCKFRCVPEVLWRYRAHTGQHFQGGGE